MRTHSPTACARVYTRIMPLAICPINPDASMDTMISRMTLSPLNTSVCALGKYGYAMASANSHNEALAMRRVAGAVCLSSMPTLTLPIATWPKNSAETCVAIHATRKMMAAMNIPGGAAPAALSICSSKLWNEGDKPSLIGRVKTN